MIQVIYKICTCIYVCVLPCAIELQVVCISSFIFLHFKNFQHLTHFLQQIVRLPNFPWKCRNAKDVPPLHFSVGLCLQRLITKCINSNLASFSFYLFLYFCVLEGKQWGQQSLLISHRLLSFSELFMSYHICGSSFDNCLCLAHVICNKYRYKWDVGGQEKER